MPNQEDRDVSDEARCPTCDGAGHLLDELTPGNITRRSCPQCFGRRTVPPKEIQMPGEQEHRCFLCGRERDTTALLHCEGREPYVCADKWNCHQATVDARRIAESRVQELEGELADVRDDLDDAEAEARAAASQWGRTREESQKKINAAESQVAAVREVLAGDPHYTGLPLAKEVDERIQELEGERDEVQRHLIRRRGKTRRLRQERDNLFDAMGAARRALVIERSERTANHRDATNAQSAITALDTAALRADHEFDGIRYAALTNSTPPKPHSIPEYHNPEIPGP